MVLSVDFDADCFFGAPVIDNQIKLETTSMHLVVQDKSL